jgi:hypothetical protein
VRSLHRELADGTLPGMAEWRDWHDTGEVPERWSRFEEEFRDADSAELFQELADKAATESGGPPPGRRRP